MSESDFVAVGKFTRLSDDGFEQAPLVNREVYIEFLADEVYKDISNQVGNEYQLKLLNTDMLIFPGGELSRYQHRLDQIAEIRPRLAGARQRKLQLQERLDNGQIDQARYESEILAVESILAEGRRLTDSARMTPRVVASVGTENFYAKNGKLTLGEKYFLFLKKSADDDQVFEIREADNIPNVLWGEELEAMLEDISHAELD